MKILKKLKSHLISPFTLGIAVTLIITYIAFVYYNERLLASKNDHTISNLIQQIHEKTVDWRLADRGANSGSPQVAILAIDEKSIEQEGRWPWPRDKMARLIDRTIRDGAKSVSFDMTFSEEDSNSATPTLTKIKRELRDSEHLPEMVGSLLDSELAKSDLDRSLAEEIKLNSDKLIMGSFFGEIIRNRPYQDFCVDSLLSHRAEGRYWKKEAIALTVFDDANAKLTVPQFFGKSLDSYFTLVEQSASDSWFSHNPDMLKKVAYTLDDDGKRLPPESLAGIAVYWLDNDFESAQAILEQVNPAEANSTGIRNFYSKFGAAFTRRDRAELAAEIRKSGDDYCTRFLTDRDELTSYENYKKIWPDNENNQANFATYSWDSTFKTSQAGKPENQRVTFAQVKEKLVKGTLPNFIPQLTQWTINIPILGDVTKHSGFFNAIQDTDGTIRRSLLFVRRGNSYMPSLALKTFLADQEAQAIITIGPDPGDRFDTPSRVVKSVEIDDKNGKSIMQIPIDKSGHMLINYAGGSHMFPHISAADILSDREDITVEQEVHDPNTGRWESKEVAVNKKDFMKDKIFFIGATAIGIYDLRVTPFEENYPGVETHANVLSNLLIESSRAQGLPTPPGAPGFLKTHPREAQIMWVVLIIGGIIFSWLISHYGSLAGLGITLCFLALIYVLDKFVLFRAGIVTTSFFPVALIILDFFALTFYKYFTEEKTKRELKGTFEKYVSPAIVAEVLADPSNIELGGKKVDMTVMFSDVRGFTTISEKLDPRELSNLLNSYLTPMTDLVFKHKGTLDKYMGDAIMSFWGAPIHFPDHAEHACRCALAMLVKLKKLQEQYRAKGLPEIEIGIGLNTGDMSVGNMGSDTVRSYTVMGDAVNLGSRLEGINKQYGTRIIISEFTFNAVKSKFTTREVDWVKVKGKNEPVRIFELVSEGQPPEKMAKLLEQFTRGYKLYHERKFNEAIAAFSLALEAQSDDACTQLYLERCQEYLLEPPSPEWDGVFTMKTK